MAGTGSERLMKPPEVAKYLGVHVTAVNKMAREGTIPATRIGERWRFRRDLLEQFTSGVLRSDDSGEGDRDGSKAGDVRKN